MIMKLHKIDKGRYALFFGRQYESDCIRVEMSRTYNFGLGFNIKREEQDLQISFYCFKLFSLWLTLGSKRLKYRNEPLDTGIVWKPKENIVTIELLSQRGMDSSQPAVVDIWWNYADWLFGRSLYSESHHSKNIKLGADNVIMKMPERDYTVSLDFYTSYWHRPRSPFVRAIERVEVTPDKPVPEPGKGENSYDLDEDAVFSCTMPVNGRSAQEIVDDFKQSIMRTREQRAGKNWRPEKEWQHPDGATQ